jgi:hypothetical protein
MAEEVADTAVEAAEEAAADTSEEDTKTPSSFSFPFFSFTLFWYVQLGLLFKRQ